MFLRTLGGLELTAGDFRRPKPLLLLAYLALEGPKPRRHLADIFYAGTTDSLNGLSRALSFLKDAGPDLFGVSGQKLETTLPCDAKTLLSLLERDDLEAALELYRGPFLEGVNVSMGEELEEWVFETREFLASRVREGLLQQGERYRDAGRIHEAAVSAERAYALPGAPELEPEDFQRMYELLVEGNSPRAAQVRKAGANYGLTLVPSRESPRVRAHAAEARRRSTLPTSRTSLIGREKEMSDLVMQLEQGDCRFVTILGPGGVGKTRLALEVGDACTKRDHFPGGVHFLSLENVPTPALLVDWLAGLFGVDSHVTVDLLVRLGTRIGEEAVLLILDACDHLTSGLHELSGLFEICPRLKIMATSRETLHMTGEWVYVLGGLPTPQREDEMFASDSHTAAIQLFVFRAKRARLQFALTPDEIPHVLRICQQVDGFPLGIELAAAWVSVLSTREISQEIEADLDFLGSHRSSGSEKAESLRAVFESSWRRLGREEQRVLSYLSVFDGGFRRSAAAEVAGATNPLLASLTDKSFLRLESNGRYDRHALLHQYMKEKLAAQPEAEAQATERHGHHFNLLLQQSVRHLRGSKAKGTMDMLREELENLRLAWAWALRTAAEEVLALSAVALRIYFDKEGRFQEGLTFFEDAARVLQQREVVLSRAAGIVLIEQAWFVFRLGRRDAAALLAERGVSLLRPLGKTDGLREGLHVLGALRLDEGNYGNARGLWREAYDLAVSQEDDYETVHSLELLGLVEELSGAKDLAEQHYRHALSLGLELGDKEGTVDPLNNLATMLIDSGKLQEAESLLRRAMKISHETGASRLIPYLTDNLAKIALERGEARRALSLGMEAFSMARESGEMPLQVRALETLGRAALVNGDLQAAAGYFRQALNEAARMNAVPLKLQLLVRAAQFRIIQGYAAEAAVLLSVVIEHAALTSATREVAASLLVEIKNQATLQDLETRRATNYSIKLDELVEKITNSWLV